MRRSHRTDARTVGREGSRRGPLARGAPGHRPEGRQRQGQGPVGGAAEGDRHTSSQPIERLPDLPRAVPLLKGAETVYEVDLTTSPSPAWRAAFLRPPGRLMRATATP